MPTTADKRRWLKDEGHNPPTHGVLPPALEELYDAAHPSANGQDDDNLFPVPSDADPDAVHGETPPTRPPRTKPAGRGWQPPWARPKTGRKKTKPKHPRVPVDELISGGWRLMARIARPVPPLERTLKLQSPIAGLLLEDAIAGTLADTALQPIARLQFQGKTAAALLGPPMLVTAGTLHMQRAAQEGKPPNAMVMGIIHEGLRETLMVWMDVAGPKFEVALKRERDFEAQYGTKVDEWIAFLFSPPANPADEEAVKAEEDAIRRAQGIMHDEASQ